MKTSVCIDVKGIANHSVVIGISPVSEGEYQGHKYSNVYLTLFSLSGDDLPVCQRVKVKTVVLPTDKPLVLGDEVKLYYDRYGNVDEIAVFGHGRLEIE